MKISSYKCIKQSRIIVFSYKCVKQNNLWSHKYVKLNHFYHFYVYKAELFLSLLCLWSWINKTAFFLVCLQGSAELELNTCTCQCKNCSAGEFQCATGICIPNRRRCDGVIDCANDEDDCCRFPSAHYSNNLHYWNVLFFISHQLLSIVKYYL